MCILIYKIKYLFMPNLRRKFFNLTDECNAFLQDACSRHEAGGRGRMSKGHNTEGHNMYYHSRGNFRFPRLFW